MRTVVDKDFEDKKKYIQNAVYDLTKKFPIYG